MASGSLVDTSCSFLTFGSLEFWYPSGTPKSRGNGAQVARKTKKRKKKHFGGSQNCDPQKAENVSKPHIHFAFDTYSLCAGSALLEKIVEKKKTLGIQSPIITRESKKSPIRSQSCHQGSPKVPLLRNPAASLFSFGVPLTFFGFCCGPGSPT